MSDFSVPLRAAAALGACRTSGGRRALLPLPVSPTLLFSSSVRRPDVDVRGRPSARPYGGGTRAPMTISNTSRVASTLSRGGNSPAMTTMPSSRRASRRVCAAFIASSDVGLNWISTPGTAEIGVPAGGLPTENALASTGM